MSRVDVLDHCPVAPRGHATTTEAHRRANHWALVSVRSRCCVKFLVAFDRGQARTLGWGQPVLLKGPPLTRRVFPYTDSMKTRVFGALLFLLLAAPSVFAQRL